MKRFISFVFLLASSIFILTPTTVSAFNVNVAPCRGAEIGDSCSYNQTGASGQVTFNGRCQQGAVNLYCNTNAVPQSERTSDDGGSASGRGGDDGGAADDRSSDDGGSAEDTPTDASSPQQVSFQNPSRFTSIPELLAGIVNAALGLLGGLAVILIVFSGIKYMMSSNPGDVAKATEGIRNAIVGLMVVMGAYLIVQFVISSLV